MPPDHRPRVLIVEDESLIAMELETFLGDFGLEVVGVADNGEDAIELAAKHRPELLMMDVMLKGAMDGIEAARRIRQSLDIPVVFLTAYGDEKTLERAKSTAPYGYLLKPYRPDGLRAAVTVALHKHRLELQLKQSEQWFAKTLHCLTDGVISADPQSRIRFMNPVAEKLTGIEAKAALGKALEDVVRLHAEGPGEAAVRILAEAFSTNSAIQPRGALLQRVGIPPVAVDASAVPVRDDEDRVLGGVVVLRDITERRRMEAELRQSEERFHSAFENAAIGMALVSTAGEILQANRAAGTLLGHGEEALRGRTLASLSHLDHVNVERPLLAALDAEERPAVQLEKLFLHANGDPVWMQMSASAVRDARRNPLCYIVQLQDITARKRAEGELAYLAHFDTLTGLRNRASFQLQLAAAIEVAKRGAASSAVLFIDLDGFKHVNDSLGHNTGDAMLRQVADRIRGAVRASDLVARMGGDEFVVLAEGAETESAAAIARKILDAVAQPYAVGGREIALTASAGISFCPSDGEGVEPLLRNADSAMYHAKEMGRNQFAYYDEKLTRRAHERLQLESALRQAVGRGELRLVYQPIVQDGRVGEMEALLRWTHPERGSVSPDRFIPIAEETGLLPEIGEWVLGSALGQLRLWRDQGRRLDRVAVNISHGQLVREGFVPMVEGILAARGLAGGDLEIEITESTVMHDPDRSIATLNALRARGVRVSIDDFGTGFSSLAQLMRLPVNRLKIDKSFVHGLPSDGGAAAVVSTIAALGRALGLSVVAEGVETAEQQKFLLEHEVTALQGYLFARPLPPDEAAGALPGSD